MSRTTTADAVPGEPSLPGGRRAWRDARRAGVPTAGPASPAARPAAPETKEQ